MTLPDLPEWMIAAIAGALGGVVRALQSPGTNLRALSVDVFVGAIVAVYLGDYVAAILSPLEGIGGIENISNAGAFLAGLLGMTLVEFVKTVLRRRADQLGGNEDA